MKKENANLKDSNENHIFINEKLNKALKKSEDRIEKLSQKIKTITNESVVLPKTSLAAAGMTFDPPANNKIIVENGPGTEVSGHYAAESFGPDGDDDFFSGDVSSIMIRPDQIND